MSALRCIVDGRWFDGLEHWGIVYLEEDLVARYQQTDHVQLLLELV